MAEIDGAIEHDDYLVVLVPTDAKPPRYTAQVVRKDKGAFTFHPTTKVEPESLRYALTTAMTTAIFDSSDEAIAAGHDPAEKCRVGD